MKSEPPPLIGTFEDRLSNFEPPSTETAFRPFCVPTSGRLPAVACTACLLFPDLSPQYPTGSLVAVAGVVPSLF
jgi:hypothetical protein